MTAMAPHHVLVVTRTPCDDDVDGAPCEECIADPMLEYNIECPGVSGTCQLWTSCEDGLEHDGEAMLDEDGLAHGVEHVMFEFGWAVAVDRCWVQFAVHEDGGVDAAAEVTADPGRYYVDHDGGSVEDFTLHLIAPVPDTEET